MDQKYKLLLKNTGYLTISTFASKVLVFLLVPIYTSVLTTEDYGRFDAIVITVQILAPVVVVNIAEGVMRFLLDQRSSEEENIVIYIGNKLTAIGIASMGVLFLINRVFRLVSFINGYEIFGFLYSLFYILNNYYTQLAKGRNKVSIMALSGVIGTVSMLLFNILFLFLFKLGVIGFLIANIIGLAIPTVYYAIKLKPFSAKPGKSSQLACIQRDMIAYSWPLVFNVVGWTINSSLDKYCVIYFYGIAASGILAVAYKIPTILNVLYSVFTQAWQISAVQEYNSKTRNDFYSKTFLLINAIGCIGCSGLLLFNRFIAGFLFKNDFYQAWKLVPFLLLSVLFNQTAGFVGPLLSAKRESKAIAKASIAGALANLVLNILLIRCIGVQGAAIATAISSFVIFFVRWLYARDLLDNSIYLRISLSWGILVVNAVLEVFGLNYIFHIACLLMIGAINFGEISKIARRVFKRWQR